MEYKGWTIEKEKTCHWCKRRRPATEVGDYELDPDNLEIEVGWICDRCLREW